MRNASELYYAMAAAVNRGTVRKSTDPASPQKGLCREADPGQTFTLEDVFTNIPDYRDIDMKWTLAALLHFFASTEEAGCLRQYNAHAEKFLTGDRWIGAYGAIAMPQILSCISLLQHSRDTRRAIVSMGGLPEIPDVNRPSCWNFLHFLSVNNRLDMQVYQRSLNLHSVFTVDLVQFTNILIYVARMTGFMPGQLHWTFGSLHTPMDAKQSQPMHKETTLVLPPSLLSRPSACMEALLVPRKLEALL